MGHFWFKYPRYGIMRPAGRGGGLNARWGISGLNTPYFSAIHEVSPTSVLMPDGAFLV